MTVSDFPLEPLVKPAPQRSSLSKWRTTVLAALSAVLPRGVPRVLPAIAFAASALTGVLAIFPLSSDDAVAMASATDAAIDSVRAASSDLKCAYCGVVESTRELAPIPDQSARRVEVTVRMKDGASHLFVAASSGNLANASNPENSASWRAGERVIFIDGRRLAGE